MTLIKSITSINFKKSNSNSPSMINLNSNYYNNNNNKFQFDNTISEGFDILISNRSPQLRWWIRWWDSYSQ
ncbi:hypothetical protein DDB_G0287145 [Dictyostelium discoideum AX4]|uniref:Putative uncharacterized protein DDB_G0287145 n=1 Tax=Dictyostelium discoideum TaxID=44689 RepID=Y7300_DICDI|nr:hypothetical protein DDB_G0287145 [Dictyostelium discoideum AX4]Q54KS5.1 RecName: Full=Putative uncharacterized protein DDB_G0287145 [Dictyostelium discoideum]EAL63847.1 hypothetical protein DDB_G0287145 [Dictyostelium discoideum AX4]|eukprot:XP_637355.1 hypothetical protein DDB_G0287145 [Dictyostelium discoideum AX4]